MFSPKIDIKKKESKCYALQTKCLNSFLIILINVGNIDFDTILYHNSCDDELWLVMVYLHMAWGHTLTHHNSPCIEVWHKVGPNSMSLTLLYTHSGFCHDGQVIREDHHQQQHREVEYLLWFEDGQWHQKESV